MIAKPKKTRATIRHHVLGPNASIQERLGAVVRACRRELGITQEELAERAEIHRTYIADVERGARNVTLRVVSNLARSLQITLGNLFAHVTAPNGAEPSVGTEPAPTEVRDILLVEHDLETATATARAFKRAKLANPLRIVRDGATGLDYLFGTGRYAKRKPVRPQLILLVPDLPDMSGKEFIRRVKADPHTRHIPIVLLTIAP